MKKKHIFLLHACLWIYLLYPEFTLVLFDLKVDPSYYLLLPLNIVLQLINFYLFYFFVIPALFKIRFKFFSVIIGLFLVGLIAGFKLVVYYCYNKWILQVPEEDLLFTTRIVFQEIRVSLVMSLYALFIRFTIDWFQSQKQKTELINQNQASEIALLRSQVNPHFLFNTLNNIYSLVYRKSDDAPEAVMRLSGIMRYMLYDSNTDKVLLEKEIEYLKSFIELQKLRIKNKDFVGFNIRGTVEGRTIAPMLLIPFVENAFKHGSKRVSSPGIMINLIIERQKIIFEVVNYVRQGSLANKDKGKGIGLQNIQRRLDLMYPDKHLLEISQDKELYRVKLVIEN
jgi:sensor histidine kinase YesM